MPSPAGLLVSWASIAAALAFAAWVLGSFRIDGFWTLVIAAALFGIVNTILKPLLTIVALPLILLTLGVAYFFVNMAMLWIVDGLVDGFELVGFWTYVAATVLVWLAGFVIRQVVDGR